LYSYLLNKEIREENLSSCYFFHGEERFLAKQFIQDLVQTLISKDAQDYNVEKIRLEDHTWAEVIDLARTIPFFFSSWRVIIVDGFQNIHVGLSSTEARLLKDYFESPTPQTILLFIFEGKIRKNASILKFFQSLPKSIACVRELKPLKDQPLLAWMNRKLQSMGKVASREAMVRLTELAGNDLSRINAELEKVVTFIGEKRTVDIDDINQITGRIRSSLEWEIRDSIANADYDRSLFILDNLFKEGIRPEFILGILTNFFKEILLAKLWLKEKEKSRKEIFQKFRPYIQEKFVDLYKRNYMELFSQVDQISFKDLNRFLEKLERIDFLFKTSDVSPHTLLERFLFEYCFPGKKK
jgi:DNA polymerase-3 subunit delta